MEQIIIEMIEKAKESQDFDLLTFAFNIIEELASTANAPSDWRSIGERLAEKYSNDSWVYNNLELWEFEKEI